MARKPQPGGDRNAWGQVMNEYLDVAHHPDGTIKPSGVQDAVSQEVETALGVQLLPAVADVVASNDAVVAAAAAAVDAEPRVSQLIDDTDNLATAMDRVDPGTTGTPGQVLQHGTSGPEWQSKAIYDVRDLVSDTTGATVVTTEFQAAINGLPSGAVINVPAGSVLNLTDTITVANEIHIDGFGELRWTAGVATKRALQLEGHGSSVRNVRITNPNKLFSHTGARNLAIDVRANYVTIKGVFFKNWQNTIIQEANGEYYGMIADGNILMDCIGTAGDGDNKGDGINAFGSGAVITNNIISALVGEDARCGIVIEGLAPYITNHLTSNGTNVDDTGFIVTGNIITGPFRRAIHAEGVKSYIIDSNVIYGPRWWGIMLSGNKSGTVTNNNITWTENGTPGDPVWTSRAGIYVQRNANVKIANNSITLKVGALSANGILLQRDGGTGGNSRYSIQGNHINCEFASDTTNLIFSIDLASGDVVDIVGNYMEGRMSRGISLQSTGADVRVSGNRIMQLTLKWGRGISLEGMRKAIVHDNDIDNFDIGVRTTSGTLAVAKHNTFSNCNTGVFGEGHPSIYAPNNTYLSVGAKTFGVTSSTLYGPA